jgi:BolA protein
VLEPVLVELEDDSHRHAGHAGAASGGGHYNLLVISSRFTGLSLIARHRLVYATLASLMQREIHALSINALTPDEAPAQQL